MSETSKVLQIGTIFHEVCEDAFLSGLSEDNRVKVALSLFIQANDRRGARWPMKSGRGVGTDGTPSMASGERAIAGDGLTHTGPFEGRRAEDHQKQDGTATKKYTFKVGEKIFTMYGGYGQRVFESTRSLNKGDKVTASYSMKGQYTNLESLAKADEPTDDNEQQKDDIPW